MRTDIIKGWEALDKEPAEVKDPIYFLKSRPDQGYCAPKMARVKMEEVGDKGISIWDYEKFLFENDENIKAAYFMGWPKDQPKPDSFEGWTVAMKDYFDTSGWPEITYNGGCLDGGMGGGMGGDFENMLRE